MIITRDSKMVIETNSLQRNKYTYLLLALLIYFCSSSLLEHYENFSNFFDLFFCIIIFYCNYIVSQKKYILYVVMPLSIVLMSTYWFTIQRIHIYHNYLILHSLFYIIFLVFITYVILSAVAKQRHITIDTLAGAICGYLLLGITWSAIYLLLATLDQHAFSNQISSEIFRVRAQHYIYFSFVTLSTLGYGDIIALSPFAKTCSWLEAITGQIYLAVWISQLVSIHIVQLQHERKSSNSSG